MITNTMSFLMISKIYLACALSLITAGVFRLTQPVPHVSQMVI